MIPWCHFLFICKRTQQLIVRKRITPYFFNTLAASCIFITDIIENLSWRNLESSCLVCELQFAILIMCVLLVFFAQGEHPSNWDKRTRSVIITISSNWSYCNTDRHMCGILVQNCETTFTFNAWHQTRWRLIQQQHLHFTHAAATVCCVLDIFEGASVRCW